MSDIPDVHFEDFDSCPHCNGQLFYLQFEPGEGWSAGCFGCEATIKLWPEGGMTAIRRQRPS